MRHCCLSNLECLGWSVSHFCPLHLRLAFFQMLRVPMLCFVAGIVKLDGSPNAFWLKNCLIQGSLRLGWNCCINTDSCIIVSILLAKVCNTTGAKLWYDFVLYHQRNAGSQFASRPLLSELYFHTRAFSRLLKVLVVIPT